MYSRVCLLRFCHKLFFIISASTIEGFKRNMKSDHKRLEDGFKLFEWTKRLSRLVGLCPTAPNYYLSNACIFYITCLVMFELICLYKYLEDIDKLIEILTENLGVMYMYTCVLMLRVNNSKIGDLMTQAIENYNVSAFKDSREFQVFMQFIDKGEFLLKGLSIYIIVSEIIWYFGPLLTFSDNSVDDNNKTLYVLPYELYLFYQIDSPKRYYLTYLLLMPGLWIIAIGVSSADCILISLVFYISGKMAVLTMRINALKSNQYDCRNELKKIIAEHIKLLQMGGKVRDAHSVTLLVYLLNVNFMMAIIAFQMLTAGQVVEALQYIVYLVEVYLILGLFCMISELLTVESLKCGKAFYNCEWYNFPLDCSNDIIYCIGRSQKSLGLDAGKFTRYSIVTLTNVSKTAFGYFSLLRTFLMTD